MISVNVPGDGDQVVKDLIIGIVDLLVAFYYFAGSRCRLSLEALCYSHLNYA
jgi:hypothetical protein